LLGWCAIEHWSFLGLGLLGEEVLDLIAWGSFMTDIGEEEVTAVPAGGLKLAVEFMTGKADEGTAEAIFVGAGRFADEEHSG
jgi:hypothetical protein